MSAAARPVSRRGGVFTTPGSIVSFSRRDPGSADGPGRVRAGAGFPIDLGCGWLHSADRNPWARIAVAQGRAIDKTPPPWSRLSIPIGFPLAEQASFLTALEAFRARLDCVSDQGPDVVAASFLEPGGRWNDLINAVSTYVSGAELDLVSARDYGRYQDSGVNWRVVEGYGTAIAAHAAGVPVVLDAPVRRIDHGGRRLRVETAGGTITADAAIVTVPTDVIAGEGLRFAPALPDKIDAAAGLPLGLADKLFLSLSDAGEFVAESRLFGRSDRSRDRDLSPAAVRPAAHRGLFRWKAGGQPRSRWRRRVLRFRQDGPGRAPRQRLRPPHRADPRSSVEGRSVRPRLLLLRTARQGRVPGDPGGAGRRSAVLRRRGVLAQRLLDGARRLPDRHRRRRAGDRGAQAGCPVLSGRSRVQRFFASSGSAILDRSGRSLQIAFIAVEWYLEAIPPEPPSHARRSAGRCTTRSDHLD